MHLPRHHPHCGSMWTLATCRLFDVIVTSRAFCRFCERKHCAAKPRLCKGTGEDREVENILISRACESLQQSVHPPAPSRMSSARHSWRGAAQSGRSCLQRCPRRAKVTGEDLRWNRAFGASTSGRTRLEGAVFLLLTTKYVLPVPVWWCGVVWSNFFRRAWASTLSAGPVAKAIWDPLPSGSRVCSLPSAMRVNSDHMENQCSEVDAVLAPSHEV